MYDSTLYFLFLFRLIQNDYVEDIRCGRRQLLMDWKSRGSEFYQADLTFSHKTSQELKCAFTCSWSWYNS